jgi:hypothetical protein
MHPRTRIPRRSRRTITPALDPLESRQLLSAAPMSAHGAALAHHHHHHLPLHHADAVGRAHAWHHGASPAAVNGFQVVAQFSNVSFAATAAIADNDIWAVGESNPDTSSSSPVAVHFNGTSWSIVSSMSRGNGVAALSDGTVVVVSSSGAIIEN